MQVTKLIVTYTPPIFCIISILNISIEKGESDKKNPFQWNLDLMNVKCHIKLIEKEGKRIFNPRKKDID